ncbi:MAG TPA: peptidoglycan-binding domain-containing protein [Candidatus Paceibacterota bacterium]
MQNFKFLVISILVLAGMGIVGYWAVRTIEPGDIYANKQKQKALEEKNKELAEEIEKLNSELTTTKTAAAIAATRAPSPAPASSPTPATKPVSSKNQTLINELQKLITDKVVMKEKSKGTRVGTIQTFLNLYNKTSKKVDNDFGKTTTANVIAFQKAVGLKADGQTGPTTYQKMIDWLKKQ